MTIWEQLARSEFAQWVQLTPFAFAAFESVHLLAVAFFFGSILLLDLRLLGIGPAVSVRPSAGLILPLTVAAFVVITVTGIALFISAADRYAESLSFKVKLGLIVLGGINLLLFHTSVWKRVDSWGRQLDMPTAVKLFGALSILVWIASIVAGRWMGYEPRLPPPLGTTTGLQGFL